MARTVALTCNNCGAPIDVPDHIRFVTCDHCNARLQIERTDGAVFTNILETVARVEKQTSATAATVRVIELERELERINAALAELHDPGGWGAVWVCGAFVVLGLFLLLAPDADSRAQASGVLSILIFGGLAGFFAIGLPRRQREYAAARAQLEAKRAELVEQLAAAREDENKAAEQTPAPDTH